MCGGFKIIILQHTYRAKSEHEKKPFRPYKGQRSDRSSAFLFHIMVPMVIIKIIPIFT